MLKTKVTSTNSDCESASTNSDCQSASTNSDCQSASTNSDCESASTNSDCESVFVLCGSRLEYFQKISDPDSDVET